MNVSIRVILGWDRIKISGGDCCDTFLENT